MPYAVCRSPVPPAVLMPIREVSVLSAKKAVNQIKTPSLRLPPRLNPKYHFVLKLLMIPQVNVHRQGSAKCNGNYAASASSRYTLFGTRYGVLKYFSTFSGLPSQFARRWISSLARRRLCLSIPEWEQYSGNLAIKWLATS